MTHRLPHGFAANLLWALLATLLLLGGDRFFAWLEPRYLLDLNLGRVAVYLAFNLLISLVRPRWVAAAFYLAVVVLSLAQMVHIRFFGTFIFPHEYYLGLTQGPEIMTAMADWLPMAAAPLALMVPLGGLLLYGHRRVLAQAKGHWAFGLALLLLLSNGPYRIGVGGDPFGRRSDAAATTFYNSYASLSYFSTAILPKKLSGQETQGVVLPPPTPLRPAGPGHVVLVIGESLGLNHLSAFGYPLPTTPFLAAMQNSPAMALGRGVSCGVSTDVAVPMLVHGVCGPGAMAQIISQNQCLFKLAKANGYQTHFYSAHSGDALKGIYNYLCPSAIDHYADAFKLTGSYSRSVRDEELLKLVEGADFSRPQFIVVQERSAHSPYASNYRPEEEWFAAPAKETGQERLIRTYDNSVRAVDGFLERLTHLLDQRATGGYRLVFMPDHGEAMGEGGRFGHLMLYEEQYTVPVAVVDHLPGAALAKAFKSRSPQEAPVITARESWRMVAWSLGYYTGWRLDEPLTHVMGTDMEGYAGYLTLKRQNGRYLKQENGH